MLRKSHVNNKHHDAKPHGQKLGETAHELRSYLEAYPDALLVREEALPTKAAASIKVVQILNKVVGVADLYAWAFGQRTWREIHPGTIKSLVAGKGDASKEDVAAALAHCVGPQEYACDDESDAVAVGVAWLLHNKEIAPWNG